MVQRVSAIAGWLALAFIVYATLSPINDRPVVAGPQLEHFLAFAVVGLAFGLAYPKRIFLVAAIVLISAFALEALQLLTPDRHARLVDALVKAGGGVFGIGIGHLTHILPAPPNQARRLIFLLGGRRALLYGPSRWLRRAQSGLRAK